MLKNPYPVRQAILRDLRAASGAPLAADELPAISAEPAILHADPADVAAEFRALCDLGFLCPVPGCGNRYCRITEKGLRQLAPEYPQDPFVWGPAAAR